MTIKIQPMNEQPQNLFPEAVRIGAMEIFGKQSIHPFLLKLLPAGTVDDVPLSDSCLSKMLHDNEAIALGGYRFAKRQSEFLTGRICAKLAIQDFLPSTKTYPPPLNLAKIEIVNTPNGRPTIRIHSSIIGRPKMDISIAHSGDYGVALAAQAKCGIDIQRQETTLLRVQKKYCSEDEYKLLETFSTDKTDNNMTTRLNILWAAKEAAKKALSYWEMPGFLDLKLRELRNFTNNIALSLNISPTTNNQMPKEVTVAANIFDEYALAICLAKEVNKDAGTT